MVDNFTHTQTHTFFFFSVRKMSFSSKLKLLTKKIYVLDLTGKHPSASGVGSWAKLEAASASLPGCGKLQSCPCSSCTQLLLQMGPAPTGEAGTTSCSLGG